MKPLELRYCNREVKLLYLKANYNIHMSLLIITLL